MTKSHDMIEEALACTFNSKKPELLFFPESITKQLPSAKLNIYNVTTQKQKRHSRIGNVFNQSKHRHTPRECMKGLTSLAIL